MEIRIKILSVLSTVNRIKAAAWEFISQVSGVKSEAAKTTANAQAKAIGGESLLFSFLDGLEEGAREGADLQQKVVTDPETVALSEEYYKIFAEEGLIALLGEIPRIAKESMAVGFELGTESRLEVVA